MGGRTARRSNGRRCALAALALAAASGPAGAKPQAAFPAALRAQLDAALDAELQRCWDGSAQPFAGYLPWISVRYDGNGRLVGEPALLNLPLGPDQVPAAASAIRAVRACDPIRLPPAARGGALDGLRRRAFRFDPEMGFVMVDPLGAGTDARDRLPPAIRTGLDASIEEQIQDCFDGDGGPVGYVPVLNVSYDRDGHMSGEPELFNLPVGPEQVELAAEALAALRKCDPLRIPDAYRRYYDQGWRQRLMRFEPSADPAPRRGDEPEMPALVRGLERLIEGLSRPPR